MMAVPQYHNVNIRSPNGLTAGVSASLWSMPAVSC